MHKTSFLKAQAFYETYVKPISEKSNKAIRILDIGSKIYENQESYSNIFKTRNIEYIGLDLEDGDNVDIVPNSTFLWREIDTESFDFCISGQTFEHNPFFWITFAEIARVLKQDGKVLIIAPGRGAVHRYPLDCWRFYPDSWQALCTYTGLSLVESMFEDYKFRRVEEGAEWCDSSVIAQKPIFDNDEDLTFFYNQLRNITATIPANLDFMSQSHSPNPIALNNYKQKIELPFLQALKARFRRKRLYKRIFTHI